MPALARLCFAVAALMAFTSAAEGANIYIAQNAAGSDTGQNCSNAHSTVWFNTANNWGAGSSQIGPGTIVHLCGTFTGTAGSTMLTIQGSGTSGNPITILFESNAVLTAPYWSTSTGAITAANKNYITIDGGANGLVQNSDNGTARSNQQESLGLKFTACNGLTVQNLTIQNIYVRTAGNGTSTGFDSQGIGIIDGSNILISHNTISNVKSGVGYAFTANGSNYEVAGNVFTGVEVPVVHATAQPNTTFTGVLIHDNDFAGGSDLWDDPVGNSFHHEALHMWAQVSGAHITKVQFYNNRIHGIWGNDTAYFNSTGGSHITTFVYPEQMGGDITIFNNIIDSSAGGALNQPDNGSIFCKATNSPGQTCSVYNNTIIGPGGSYGIGYETDGGPGHTVMNNIFYNLSYAIYPPNGDSNVVSDYNLYYGVSNWGGTFESFAQWQAAGQDKHAINGIDPKLQSNYTPLSSSVNGGVNLTNLNNVALDRDIAGTSRPATGAWTIGAIVGSGGSSPTPPSAPTGLTVSSIK